jgi:predicted aminopeptidase
MLRGTQADLAGVLFHELGHQKVFAAGDTAFTESFATTVEIEGVRRWLKGQDPMLFAAYQLSKQRSDQFYAMALKYKQQLEAVYASDKSPSEKRQQKQRVFAGLRQEYQYLKKQWRGYDGYDNWVEHKLNNAKLASIGNYRTYVPALQKLLLESNNDLTVFYQRAEQLARMNKNARLQALKRLDHSL